MKGNCQKTDSRYVLISACRNEGGYIDSLIEMISHQTLKPMRWVIIDDGSTDDTYDRAKSKSFENEFLDVIKMPKGRARSFASQAYAAQYGYGVVKKLEFDFVGFLDADIELEKDYYQKMIERLKADESIGLIGGKVIDIYGDKTVDARAGSESYHVAGGVQLFRRSCFDRIGGYCAIEGGGQDTIADIMTMMHGWKVKTISGIICRHLRPQGSVKTGVIRRGMLWGKKFYSLGYHPLYYIGQCFRQIRRGPTLIGTFWQFVGFIAAALRGEPRVVNQKFIHFLRSVQMRRIRSALKSDYR